MNTAIKGNKNWKWQAYPVAKQIGTPFAWKCLIKRLAPRIRIYNNLLLNLLAINKKKKIKTKYIFPLFLSSFINAPSSNPFLQYLKYSWDFFAKSIWGSSFKHGWFSDVESLKITS